MSQQKVAAMSVLWVLFAASCHGRAVNRPDFLDRSGHSLLPPDDESYAEPGKHTFEHDHALFAGSYKEAEEIEELSPMQAKERLQEIIEKIDKNQDKTIDLYELGEWLAKSYRNLAKEESMERFEVGDRDEDGLFSWSEYASVAIGVNDVNNAYNEAMKRFDHEEVAVAVVKKLKTERELWDKADFNNDGNLTPTEFYKFNQPGEHEDMLTILMKHAKAKDTNGDGALTFDEHYADDAPLEDFADKIYEEERFYYEMDNNKNYLLEKEELETYFRNPYTQSVTQEVTHMFSDTDHDLNGKLDFDEIINNYETFVGSRHLMRLDDEL